MYTEITLGQFREFLKKDKGWKEVAPAGQEIYFDFIKDGFTIRVHSSILCSVSRNCGKDAIRVSIVLESLEKTAGIKRFPRVTRQQNWQSHLKGRVMAAFEYIKTIRKCPRCGSVLASRTAKETGNEFFGCTRYPLCRYTESVQ